MTKENYQGKGKASDRGTIKPPSINHKKLTDPENYLASRDLAAAVDVALTLGMPLLLTGEPGSGKSQLAHSVAWELNLGDPLKFVVKSDTQARDLFYHFDTVGRFHAAHVKDDESDPREYLSFSALGQAILYAHKLDTIKDRLGAATARLKHPGEARRSVVLIDEIDKAPRDVPNDILTEIEEMKFHIPEVRSVLNSGAEEFRLNLDQDHQEYRPIVIITSNAEKSLPDAFLRRCVYYHVPFPKFSSDESPKGDEVAIEDIVSRRLGHRFSHGVKAAKVDPFITDSIAFFQHVRNQGLERKPSLAELLNWLNYCLARFQPQGSDLSAFKESQTDAFVTGIKSTLLKNKADHEQAEKLLNAWLNRKK